VPLFQEQLLRMAMVIAGFSGGEAEELRRALGFRRSTERMRSVIERLHEGMSARGIEPSAQEEIAKQIRSFALYGFPESHAASFALLAYASAYIRAHHPACFLTAMLNCYPLGFYSPATLVQDAQHHGVVVRSIDVQHSGWTCTIEPDGAVRVGLRYVNGLREAAGRRIAAAAPYTSIAALAERAALRRDELEQLAEVGACASLGTTRREALWQVAALRGELLAQAVSATPSPLEELSAFEATLADYRGTGLTTELHLMGHLRSSLCARGILSARALAQVPNGRWVRVAGMVIVRQRPGSAKGFIFLTLEDETGMSNVIVIPKCFARYRSVLLSAGILLVEGPLQNQEGVIHVRGQRFEKLGLGADAVPPSHDFR
jgi:error-prone DNA polymerase